MGKDHKEACDFFGVILLMVTTLRGMWALDFTQGGDGQSKLHTGPVAGILGVATALCSGSIRQEGLMRSFALWEKA